MILRCIVFIALVISVTAAPHRVNLKMDTLELKSGQKLKNVTIWNYDEAIGAVLLHVNRDIVSIPFDQLPASTAKRVVEAAHAGTTMAQRERMENDLKDAVAASGTQAATAALEQERQIKTAQPLARLKAEHYFLGDASRPLGSIRLMGQGVKLEAPVAVLGWSGRYLVCGTVDLGYLDSQGKVIEYRTRSFEVTTGPNAEGHIGVLDFTAK